MIIKIILALVADINYGIRLFPSENVASTNSSFLLSKLAKPKYIEKVFKEKEFPIALTALTDNNIAQLLSKGKLEDKQKGVEKFLKLVDDYIIKDVKKTHEKMLEHLKQNIKEDLLNKANEEDMKELIKTADNIYELKKDDNFRDPHPVLTHFASLLGSRIVNKYLGRTQSKNETIALTEIAAHCFESGSKSNFDILEPVKEIVIAEIPTVQLEPAVVENYPDYEEHEPKHGDYMNKLKKHTSTLIESIQKAGQILAKTMKTGEHEVRSSGNQSATVVFKDIGKIVASTKIDVLHCVLLPSKDFANSNNTFEILISTWHMDLMWWNQRKTRVATPVVNIQFWHSPFKKQIKHFKAPASVILKIKPNMEFVPDVIEGSIKVPQNYRNLSGTKLNPHVEVYKVTVPNRTVLHINFFDLNDAIDVSVRTQNLPTYKDFTKNTTITGKNDSAIFFVNNKIRDVWFYVAILPSKTVSNTNSIIKFNVTFTISCCMIWDMQKFSWKPACTPGKLSSNNQIHCECKHFSVISGYTQNAQYLHQEFEYVPIELELQSCNIIFITVAINFGIFCLLLVIISSRPQEEIYYLADNASDDRYAYILVVRTENAGSAGTTSNVVVKLTGSKSASVPHVLNCPDAKMRLLQKQGEDIFVLTTPRHLGDLTKVELWYDCQGAAPSWNCRDILVFDMQSRTECYFKIKSQFDITKGVIYMEKAAPGLESSEDRYLPFCKRFAICNHFHTWQMWAAEKNFRFMAKQTTVFSTILMMYMFVLLFHGVPLMEIRDCLDPYPSFRLDGYLIFTALASSFLSFTIHIIIAWIFRFSDIQFKAFDKRYKKTHNYSWICWLTLSILIGVSMSFLMIFGFWVPYTSSVIWLVCSLIGLIFDVVILENLVVIVQTYHCKFRLTYPFEQKFTKFVNLIEGQKAFITQKFGAAGLRPFFQHLYRPLRPFQLVRRRIIVKLRRDIVNDLEDLVMYSIYNVVLHFLVIYNKAPLTLISKSEIESMLDGEHTRTLKFTKVASLEQIYNYINETLLPVMHPAAWYADYAINRSGMMTDNCNRFIGVARLRQHRIGGSPCSIDPSMSFLKVPCWPEFNILDEESRSFRPGWAKRNVSMGDERLDYIWKHRSGGVTGSVASMGEFATYSGGGYVAYLGRSLFNSYTNLLKLYEFFWIDYKSRSVFIEFLVYNANYNIFNAVRLVFEQSATGYVVGNADIYAVKMLLVENELEMAANVIYGLFVGWVMMLMIKLIAGIVKNIRTFYKKFWLMLDLVINIVSLSSITVFLIRMKIVEQHVLAMEEAKHNVFIPYFDLFYIEDVLTVLSVILICIATCRLWRFLRFNVFFQILERSLSMASFPLFAVSLSFFVMLGGFALSGLLVFGNQFPELSTFMKFVATLIQLTLKPEDYPLLEYAVTPLGYAFFTLYLMLMQVILFIYVVVIIMAYTKARLECSTVPDSYTVTDYVREQIEFYPKLLKYKFHRMRGGAFELDKHEEKSKPVTAKADEFRYANCVGVPHSQMTGIKFVTSCVVRNMTQSQEEKEVLTPLEINLMLNVCNQFVLKTTQDVEYELFFKGHFEGENFRLVDEKRIDKMAAFVEIMLEGASTKAGRAQYHNTETTTNIIRKKMDTLRVSNLQVKLLSCILKVVEKDLVRVLEHHSHHHN